jgi:GTP pyrophosphokinase
MIEKAIKDENKAITAEYKKLLRISYRTLSRADKKMIRQAFEVAMDAHDGQRRKSGEAYIFHPLAVAQIVAYEIGLDATSIVAALLHDVVEDSEYTLSDIERLFNETVAKIVDGLTKIGALRHEKDVSLQAENFRKMLLTLNDDVRVIIIKIADRLHNMETMDAMRPDKQVKIASETLYIYAPLAHRIGLYNIKSELEDLSLKYTEPEVYDDILKKIKETKEQQDAYIKEFSNIITKSLDKENFTYGIKGRPKSIYSIKKKMVVKNIPFEEIYDKFAIRIIYESDDSNEKFLAWKIYSIVTDHFRPNPVRLRDWISSPKTTGYEALHITVMGPAGRWVEVQIRSERMNEIAEKGYAAHYKYKHAHNTENQDQNLEGWLNKLQEAIEENEVNAGDFVEEFKMNLYSKEIFVFTPKGDLKSFPKGACPIDFAFSIHTDIGLTTRGAKVNGKLVPLDRELKSGDQVDIITSENAKPSNNWLNHVVTGKARSKIKSALKSEKHEIADRGKQILKRKLKAQKLPLNEKIKTELVRYFKLHASLDLFFQVGNGKIDNQAIKNFANQRSNRFVSYLKHKIRKPKPRKEPENGDITPKYTQLVFGPDEQKLDYKLASCCKPIPGDQVFGFLTINEGIKVHKKTCPNAIEMQSNYAYRIMKARWIDASQEDFKAVIKLSGLDNLGLVSQITEEISNNLHVDIKSISFDSQESIFEGRISLVVKNKNILEELMGHLKKIEGIDRITRE